MDLENAENTVRPVTKSSSNSHTYLFPLKVHFRQRKTKKVRILQKKLRHIEHYRCCARLDVEQKQGENFAMQNSRQEFRNPRMDFRFHIFGNVN